MSKGFRLLRIEYVFSVLMPCLFAIYLNGYDLIANIWILAGFVFYAITGNTLNDVIDMKDPSEKETIERVEGYSRKEILVISIGSFIVGTTCFMNEILINPLGLVLSLYLIIIVFMVIFYCLFKSLVVVNHIILGTSHIVLPWFMIKITSGDVFMGFLPSLPLDEWLILGTVISVAFTGQMVHEMIDGDSLSKLKPRKSQLIIWCASIVSLIITIISFFMTPYLEFLPIIFFPIGTLYIFRKPRNNLLGRSSLKDIGIILGNLMFAYIIILVIAP